MPEPAPFLVLLPVLYEIPHPGLTRLNASRDLHEIDQRMGKPRHLWIFAISRFRLDFLCRPPVVNGNGPAFDGRQWSPHCFRDDDFHELNAINRLLSGGVSIGPALEGVGSQSLRRFQRRGLQGGGSEDCDGKPEDVAPARVP